MGDKQYFSKPLSYVVFWAIVKKKKKKRHVEVQ